MCWYWDEKRKIKSYANIIEFYGWILCARAYSICGWHLNVKTFKVWCSNKRYSKWIHTSACTNYSILWWQNCHQALALVHCIPLKHPHVSHPYVDCRLSYELGVKWNENGIWLLCLQIAIVAENSPTIRIDLTCRMRFHLYPMIWTGTFQYKQKHSPN